ncbi:diguanylate cyclase domain-containing protein [Anaerotruncus rubiinfantis]|uniref:diguanylate cyclase domain-containing protein n=1 Tax=Anaerotruncus rubiinfantis TaxID=1720200 RepID=UPI00189B0D5B
MNTKSKILIVDDAELNRSVLADILDEKYEIIEAENGLEAIAQIERNKRELSLVLLDIMMPEVDGFEVLAIMNKNKWLEQIPVIIISSETSPAYIENAYDLGAMEYISRPFEPRTVQHRVSHMIMLYSKQKHLENMVTEQMLEKEKSNQIMVDVLSHIVEFRNGESGMHVLNIRLVTELLLRRLCAVTDRYRDIQTKIPLIANASALHDIGKISIDEKILNKPDRLTAEEYETMKFHSIAGANMLEKTQYYPKEELVKIARDICRWHHERYDGGGYPDGLVGDEIPIEAQVVALADVYDALTHERVYKKAYSHEQSMQMIMDGRCGVFNPLLLRCLTDIGTDLEKELKICSLGKIPKMEAHDLAQSLLQSGNASNRTLALLEQERVKYQFFAAMSREIQFEYSFQTDMLVLSEWGAARLGLPEITIYSAEKHALQKMMEADDYSNLREQILSASHGEPTVIKSYRLNIRGQRRWHKILARPLWSGEDLDEIIGIIGKCIDVHDELTEVNSLKQVASTDELTGLYRREFARRKITETLAEDTEAEKRFALILFDLDLFKNANDQYGHVFGDQVLRAVAHRLQKVVRNSDVVARAGGDEFMIFLEYKADIDSAAKRIFTSLNGTYNGFDTTISMGIALAPTDATEYEKLFHYADQALYTVKHKGRNGYCFYDKSMTSPFSALSPISNDNHS